MSVPSLLRGRRSVRAFAPEPVPHDVVDTLVEAACLAPAPHHSRPWRFVAVESEESRGALATQMGARWRVDLERDGLAPERIAELVEASRRKIGTAPLVLLACLTDDGLDHYPDAARQDAEHGMALLSLGAAVENLMLAAHELGYASCWVAAPIFCPDVARDALALDADWLAYAMVLVGRPDPDYTPRVRPPVPLEELRRFV